MDLLIAAVADNNMTTLDSLDMGDSANDDMSRKDIKGEVCVIILFFSFPFFVSDLCCYSVGTLAGSVNSRTLSR